MKTKICTQCKRKLLLTEFWKDRTKPDGHEKKCKKCRSGTKNEYLRKWHNQKRVLFNNIKINGCAICGYDKCFSALEFHHVNEEDKKFEINLSKFESYGNNDIISELNKCILLCANCHRELHNHCPLS